ncbi:MAG: hypothetical protein ACU85V_00370 [Gammaproteobacteria bacterium]
MNTTTHCLRRDVCACVLSAIALLTVSVASQAQEGYEAAPYFNAAEFLPKEMLSGPNHRVDPTVKNDGLMNTYVVSSQYGSIEAHSDEALAERIHEFNVIAQLDALKGTDQFVAGAKKSASKVYDGAKKLMRDPVHSVGSAASGVGKMFRRTGNTLFGDPPADAQDGRMKALLGQTGVKRAYAKQFGVDPYSDNPYLQEYLDDVAWAGYAGGVTASLAFAAVPGGAGIAMSVTRNTSTFTEIDVSRAPSDLRAENEAKLKAMGASEEVVDLFLDNPAYPPTLQSYLTAALDQMGGVERRDLFVKAALQTDQQDVAAFRRRQAEMFAGYHRKVAALQRFHPARNGAAAIAETKDGTIVFVAPTDYVSWVPFVGRVFEAAALNPLLEGRKKELWLRGGISEQARSELEGLGWKVVDRAYAKLF